MPLTIDVKAGKPAKLLTPTGGFLTGYSHTLNPYTGCAFGCSYCYVRRMPVALFRGQPWGSWVNVKQPASGQLAREIRSALRKASVTIFMSSSTDPYQPAEYAHQVTKQLLTEMVLEKPDFLFVQTRSPLILRDLPLLEQLKDRLLISMTVETDMEPVRRAFAPASPPLAARLRALRKLKSAGLPVQAAVAPLLPHSRDFAAKLSAIVDRVVIDDYFRGDGSEGRRTRQLRIQDIYTRHGWDDWYDPAVLERTAEQFCTYMPPSRVLISRDGFMPPDY